MPNKVLKPKRTFKARYAYLKGLISIKIEAAGGFCAESDGNGGLVDSEGNVVGLWDADSGVFELFEGALDKIPPDDFNV